MLLQGGLYGTIVSYDPENLDQPAVVEIAPGVVATLDRRAVAAVARDVEVESELENLDEEPPEPG